MLIDRSCSLLDRHEKAFYTGLTKFINDWKPLVNSAGNIKCPCKSCRIVLWVSIKNLLKHITRYGWDPNYKTWVHHGEPDLPSLPPVIDNTRQPQMSDMIALLNYLSYIPPNNKQNEPTQGDIGETSNEPTQAKHNEFKDLYASANEELYPDCDYVTQLDFMAKFAYFNVKNVHFCLVYKMSRWKDSNTPGMKVPKKVLCYFLIIPRLQRLYKSSHTTKEMTWHATGKYTEPGKMQHPVDDRAWKNFDTKYPNFVKEPRNVRLGLAADGFNPFGNLSQAYKILQQYLPDEVAILIIERCSFFKQIISTTLMEGDMLKAQSKVVDIMCNLELIYPPAFFDIMIHLVIHLPLDALDGGPIRPRWMFLFERFMKKLKGYVRNKAKPKCLIAEGYVAEEALTFSSHYFRDVTTKFNQPDRNVDPPPPKCQFQVFRSLRKLTGLRSVIRFDAQELKKVIWYVLHNSPEIDTYWSNSRVVLFRVKSFDTSNEGRKVKHLVLRNNMTQILTKGEAFKDDQYILAIQVKQCFNLEDMARRQPHWKVVKHVNHKKFLDGGVIVVEEDLEVIYFDNSSDLPLFTSLNDLDNATLHIDDALPHDLANSNNEDLLNVDDDDGVDQMLHEATVVTVAVMIVPLHTIYPPAARVASLTDAKAPKNTIWVEGKPAGCIPARRPETSGSSFGRCLYTYLLGKRSRNQAGAAQNRQNRAKNTVVCRQGSQSLARLRDQMMESSATRKYPSAIHTFFVTHTVNGALGSNTSSGVPYTEEEINALARKGKQRGHFPGVGRVLPGRATDVLSPPPPQCTHNSADYESSPEFGNASGSGGCGDDEMAGDEDGGEDEEDEEDGDSSRCYIWRQVAWEGLDLSLEKVVNVVVSARLSFEAHLTFFAKNHLNNRYSCESTIDWKNPS
nr:hypothetical protein [Tanacetum cinerariifolium]